MRATVVRPRTDLHRAAQLGGDAVLGITPHWLVFVGGLEWSQHLEGVREKPIALSVPDSRRDAKNKRTLGHAEGYGILTQAWTVPTASDGSKLELLDALRAMAPARQGPR